MAERFGGRYSPGAPRGAPAPEGRRVDPVGARANLLWVPPVLAAFASVWGGPGSLALGLLGAGALALGAWLLREGLRAEAAFEARPAARRPALPRKVLAALLAGVGAAMLALSGGAEASGALLYAAAAAGLHLLAFGLDPLRDRLVPGLDAAEADRAARAAAEAEALLAAMRDAVAPLGDRPLDARVQGLDALARRLIRLVEEDPGDLAGARRYLGVYLEGARDAALKYAALARRSPDPAARREFEALLGDLETTYAARAEALAGGGREDLEIEVKVLRDRLRREGAGPG